MSALAACEACARHIRVREERCPFCGHETSTTFRAITVRPPPTARHLSRAALFALGAASLTGCAQSMSVYGGPPLADTGVHPSDAGDAGGGDAGPH